MEAMSIGNYLPDVTPAPAAAAPRPPRACRPLASKRGRRLEILLTILSDFQRNAVIH